MPTVLIINPNTSRTMTEEISETAARVVRPPWQYEVVRSSGGPESLESSYDYSLATIGALDLQARYPEVDGTVLACFGDPGLLALKEVAPGPVVGIAEASMSAALLIGFRFGILMGLSKAIPLTENLIYSYGLEKRFAGISALDMPVLDFSDNRAATLERLIRGARELRERGAESLILGCAGLTGMSREVEEATGLPVIDPVEVGIRTLMMLVESGLNSSRVGLYMPPDPKTMIDAEQTFSAGVTERLRRK